MTPAKYLKDDAITRELQELDVKWAAFRSGAEGGGSPGEWMIERIEELDLEQRRRALGGALQTEIPMQSR